MKLITKNTDYAIRALLEIGCHKNAFISARDIARHQKIPYQYLRKILQVLIKNGMIVSKEGSRGGFHLCQDPHKIKLVDVIVMFQGPIEFSECMFRKQLCPNRSRCVLRPHLLAIEKEVTKKFATLSIGKLLKKLKLTERKR